MGINSSSSSITGMVIIINVTNRNRTQYINGTIRIQDRCIVVFKRCGCWRRESERDLAKTKMKKDG